MNFERGISPKDSLKIGIQSLLDKLNGIIIYETLSLSHTLNDEYPDYKLVIIIKNDNYRVFKNKIDYDIDLNNPIKPISKLRSYLQDLVEEKEELDRQEKERKFRLLEMEEKMQELNYEIMDLRDYDFSVIENSMKSNSRVLHSYTKRQNELNYKIRNVKSRKQHYRRRI